MQQPREQYTLNVSPFETNGLNREDAERAKEMVHLIIEGTFNRTLAQEIITSINRTLDRRALPIRGEVK